MESLEKAFALFPHLEAWFVEHFAQNWKTTSAKVLATALTSCLGYYTLKIYLVRRKYAHIPGPSTKGISGFFLGNLINVKQEKGEVNLPETLLEWHKKYGSIIKFQFFDKVMLSTTDKDFIKHALIVKNYPKPPAFVVLSYPFGLRYMGSGLVTDLDNHNWRQQRSIFNPGFHRNVLMNFVTLFNSKADVLMERLRSLADGKTVIKLFTELNHTTLDAISIIAFGMNTDSINGKDTKFNECISGSLRIIQNFLHDPLFGVNPLNIGQALKLKEMIKYLRGIGKDRIVERLNVIEKKERDLNEFNDILAGILKNAKTDQIDMEQMIDNFITFFIAGQETTANSLAFCFLELAKNPRIFQKCRDEVDQVLGSKTGIEYEDIPKLKYVSCVFKEALRLFPPAPIIRRLVNEEVYINGYRIPADSGISLSTYVCCRLEENFPNCLEFNPERFSKETETSIPNYCYFPFSIGPRNCIGQNFAQIEGVTIIAKLVQYFDFELDKTQSMKTVQEITMRPLDGTRVTLSLRK